MRALIVLLLLTCAVYAPSAGNQFPLDDAGLASATAPNGQPNRVIADWHAPWWFFGQRYWEGTDNPSVLYRPMSVMSYGMTYQLLGRFMPEALPQHLLNILLYAGCVWLVWWMFRDLGRDEMAALLGAGVFAFHAIHSEVVASIVGRAELFGFGFGMLGTLLFARGRHVAAMVWFFAAFCSKESALAWAPFLPCYLFARDALTSAEPDWRGRWRAMAWVLGAGIVGFFALRYFAVQGVVDRPIAYEHNPLVHVDAGTRILSATAILGYGAWLCIAPFTLYSTYGAGAFPIVESLGDVGFLVALVVLLAALVLGLRGARRRPLGLLAVALFFGFMFLVSNVPFAVGTNFAERLYFTPSLAVSVLVVMGFGSLQGRAQRVMLVLAGLWCLAGSVVIVQRSLAWFDSHTLFHIDGARFPGSAEMQGKLGYVYQLSDPDRALGYFNSAVARDPNLDDSWLAMGKIHERRRHLPLAEKSYASALATKYIATSPLEDTLIDSYMRVLAGQGKLDAAFAYAKEVLARKPGHFGARLMCVDLGAGRMPPAESYAVIEAGLKRYPQSVELVLREAMHRYDHRGQSPEENRYLVERLTWALEHTAPAQRSHGAPVRAQLYLGDVLKRTGQNKRALEVFRIVLKLQSLPPEVRKQVEGEVRSLSK